MMDVFPLPYPSGPGFDYDGTFKIFPVLLPSSRIATSIYIRTIRRLESNAICSELINNLLRRVRINDKISWSNNRLSKYSTCSSIIARETGRIYRRDDITFDQWQYMILRKKFKRLLMEHGDCPKFLCTQLIAEMMNIIKNDIILRNLLILSNDRFVEAIMSRLIEQALNEKVYSFELKHSCEDVNKFGIIKKHLLRAVGASAIAQTAAKLWGWKGSNDKLLMPPPIAPPSKLSAENYCLYLCGNDKNAKKMFKMTSSIPVNFKDGSIPLPKVFFPFSAGNDDDDDDDDLSIQAEEFVARAIEKEINKDVYHNAEPPFDNVEVSTPTNIKSHGETVWDVVQRRHRSRSESDKSKGSPHTTQNNQSREIECDGNDMQNLIREHYHISEHVLSSHTQPFANAYKKPKAVKWSATDTQRFYTAIETFGTDFMLVRAHLPEFTDRQIYDKFKLEERKNPQLIQNALSANRTISLNQYEKQHGKIDVSTHYNPDNDPYLNEDATPKKISLTLKEESITPSANTQEAPSPEPDVDNKIINLFV